MLNLALVATLRAAGLAHIIDFMDIYTYPFKPSAARILFTENRHKWNPNTISLYILYFYNCMPAMLQCGGGGALDVNRQVLRHRFGRVMSHGGIYTRGRPRKIQTVTAAAVMMGPCIRIMPIYIFEYRVIVSAKMAAISMRPSWYIRMFDYLYIYARVSIATTPLQVFFCALMAKCALSCGGTFDTAH